MKAVFCILFGIYFTLFLHNCRAETTIDVLDCKLSVPSDFKMRFDLDGRLVLDGNAKQGSISVIRYVDIKWGDKSTMPKSKYGTNGSLATQATYITTKKIKVVQVTDKHNVVMFFGSVAGNWQEYLRNCDDRVLNK